MKYTFKILSTTNIKRKLLCFYQTQKESFDFNVQLTVRITTCSRLNMKEFITDYRHFIVILAGSSISPSFIVVREILQEIKGVTLEFQTML